MVNLLLGFVKRRWVYILIALSVIAFIINTLLFYPGYMSNDTLAMFNAARGQTPTNMAPVLLGLVWRVLYNLTGKNSSMLIFQLAMLWSALCLLSIYAYKKSSSKMLSLACLVIGALPFVVNISGVIWRDNLMTFSLALAVAIFLFAKDVVDKRKRAMLFGFIFALTLFSALARYNAPFGVVPVFFLFAHFSGYIKKIRWQFVATAGFILLTVMSYPVVDRILGVRGINNSPGLLLDDIIRVSQDKDINTIAMPEDLRLILKHIKQCSTEKDVLVSNIFICHKDGDDYGILYTNSDKFKSIWVQTIMNNPVRYVSYKMQMFMSVLVPQTDYAFIWQSGIEPNSYGAQVQFQRLGEINYSYTHKVGYRYLRATFEPWFWLVFGAVIFGLSMKRKTKHDLIIKLLIVSGATYIIGYIPTGVATDYRYIYWSVFAIMFAFILYLLDRYNLKHAKNTEVLNVKKVKRTKKK